MYRSFIFNFMLICQLTRTQAVVDIFNTAKNHGINIIYKNSEYNLNNNIYGGYSPTTKEIKLYNKKSLFENNRYNTTLKHELIHAIQHCKGNRQYFANLLNTLTFTACLYNDYVDLTFIIKFYEKYDWQIEIEAYCLENILTYESINKLLKTHC